MPSVDARDEIIAEQARVIAELRAEIAELKARLGSNSTNSSKPPSSDPPGVGRPKQQPSGRTRGAQPGHKVHKRELLPPEQVSRVVDLLPKACDFCEAPLRGRDPAPFRRQIVELPPIKPDVTELRIHALLCPCCGKVTRGRAPVGTPRGAFGPRLLACISLLTGKFGITKRPAREFLSDVLGIDLSLGSVSKAEAIVSDALAPAVDEAAEHVRAQPVANLDETGWSEDKQRAWLWVATTALVTVFKVATSRGGQVARQLLGERSRISDIVNSWQPRPKGRIKRERCESAPAPKVRAGIETRWTERGWEKYLKTKGWVPA